MLRVGLAMVALAWLLGSPGGGAAQVRDLELQWLTVRTEHFEIHYHTPLGMLARRVASVAERAHARLSPLMGHQSQGRVQIVLTDGTDSANGSASVIPFPVIRLYATAPEDLSTLGDHDDWLTTLLVHEHTHILHLDDIGGLPALINAIFGRVYAPNSAQPSWFIEGYATELESALTSGGRLRSSLFRMYLRMALLEGRAPRIDALSSGIDSWPQGSAPYLYGAFFVDYIARRHGQQALAEIAHAYGRAALPYGLNRIARRVTGSGFVELYEAWLEEARAEAEALRSELEAGGLEEGRALTAHGQIVRSPRFIAADRIAYFAADGRSNGELRELRLDPPRPGAAGAGALPQARSIARANGTAYLCADPTGRFITFDSSDASRDLYWLEDLFRLDRQTQQLERLTVGLRAREPDVSPDGRQIVFAIGSAGSSHLMIAESADVTGTRRVLHRSERFEQVYTPRFSPDGRKVAFSAWRAGGLRDILLLDLESRELQEITSDRALDTGPAFSADGRFLYFSSDRTGIANLYAHDLEGGPLRQITNVLGGAYHPAPSPDGRTMVYIGYSSAGFDLRAMPLEPSRWRTAPPALDDRPPPTPEASPAVLEAEPYDPLPTSLPRAYRLGLQEDGFGPALSLSFAGGDVVGYFAYAAEVRVSLVEGHTSAELGLHLLRAPLPIGLRLFRRVSRRGGLVVADAPRPWIEEAHGAELAISYSIPRSFHREGLRLSYSLTDLRKGAPFGGVLDPNTSPPTLPSTGRLARLRAGWSYSDTRRHTFDITPSYGRSLSLSLSLADPAIGSEFRSMSLSWAFAHYLENPWIEHHVLALRYAGGLGAGDLGHRGIFWIGGFPEGLGLGLEDLLGGGIAAGGQALRGYPRFDRPGTQMHLVQAEYRFPIVRAQRGLLTLPFYVRRLYASVFADFGDAFYGDLDLERFRWGFGAELFVDLTLGYHVNLSLRTGLAYGPNDGGGLQWYSHLGLPF